jgi:hypothetical protein
MATRRFAAIAMLVAIALAYAEFARAQAALSSIEFHLIDGDSGNPVGDATVVGYWSKPAPVSVYDIACASSALIGLPAHCSGDPPIVVSAVEVQSDAYGRVFVPDPEGQGWESKRALGQWLGLAVFKDGYDAVRVGRVRPSERQQSFCASTPDNTQPGAISLLVFPLMSHCRVDFTYGYARRADADRRSEAERRWDSAKQFASSIEKVVEHAEDRYSVISALRGSIAMVDHILLQERPSTRRFAAWERDDVFAVVRELRGQPKYILKRKVPGQLPKSSVEVRAP